MSLCALHHHLPPLGGERGHSGIWTGTVIFSLGSLALFLFLASLGVLLEGIVCRLPRMEGLLSPAYSHAPETLMAKEHQQEKAKEKRASPHLLPLLALVVGPGFWSRSVWGFPEIQGTTEVLSLKWGTYKSRHGLFQVVRSQILKSPCLPQQALGHARRDSRVLFLGRG